MKPHPTAKRDAVLDELLVLRAQEGDARSLSLLAGRWQKRLLLHAFRLTGDGDGSRDVAQDAWVAIVRGLTGLDDVARFPAWAYRIVGNKSRDWIRSRQRHRTGQERLAREPVVHAVDPGWVSERDPNCEIERLRVELRKLDPGHRVVLSLFYLEGFSVRRIAAALHLPEGTVKSRLFHARERLRRALLEGDAP